MLLKLVLGAALTLLPAGMAPVAAASFDCGKASTPFETAICSDPELSKKDEVLAVAYATAIGGLSKPALAEMRAGQKAWLDFAERSCTADAQPLRQGSFVDDGLVCLRTAFDNRIRALESSRMFNGFRIYSVDRYATMPDPDAARIPDYYWKVATKRVSTPRIDGVGPLAKAFNAHVANIAPEFDARIGATESTSAEVLEDGSTDDEMVLEVSAITARRITLTQNDYWFGHGAAHGNYVISYRHFLVVERRPLAASDIFAGEDWPETLLPLVAEALRDKLGDVLMLDNPKDIAEAVADPSRWDFADEALVVQFQPYEVSAYAYGAPTVEIPFEALGEVLTPAAMEIASSY